MIRWAERRAARLRTRLNNRGGETSAMTQNIIGRVLGIAIRTGVGMPMRELDSATVEVDGGLLGDVKPRPERGVTFISAQQWREVQGELNADIPWHTRRANVLVDAGALGWLIDRTVRLGPVVIHVRGETKPCGLMDKLHSGLRSALLPDFRAGVFGRVVQGGAFQVGSALELVESDR